MKYFDKYTFDNKHDRPKYILDAIMMAVRHVEEKVKKGFTSYVRFKYFIIISYRDSV